MNTDHLLQSAEKAFGADDTQAALSLCEALLEQSPGHAKGLRLKAIILAGEGRLAEAIALISGVLLHSSGNEEPCDYFYRGRWYLRNGEDASAIKDFSALLAMEAQYDRPYYSDTALLHRAYAHTRLGRQREALADLRAIADDDCSTSIAGEVTNKRALLASLGVVS
ncbi:MAG: tetratricopeptide repeat protein [Massilia sp.]